MPVSLLLALALTLPPALDEADDQYNFIVGLADKGHAEMVVKEAGRFLANYKGHPKAQLARFRLAIALFDLTRLEQARPHFEALTGARGFEFGDEVRFRLGQCELERGEFEAAVRALEPVAEKAGYLATASTFLLGEAYFRSNRFAEAEGRYTRVMRADDAGDYAADAAHGFAWCAYRLERYDQAIERIGSFLETWPRDERTSELRFLAGESQLEAGRPREALAAYQRVTKGPFHDAALRGAGFAAAATLEHAQSAAWFGRLVETYPNSRYVGEAILHQGIQLLKAGDAEAASNVLKSKAAGNSPEVFYWRGRAAAKLADHQRALRFYDRALGANPEQELAGRLQVARGDALYELGRTDEAAQAFERAGSDYALHAAAVAKLNDGEHEEAVRLARLLLAPGRDSEFAVEARLTLAEGLFAQAQYTEAEAAFRVVAADDSDSARTARALSRVGWCRYLAGDAKGAAKTFQGVARSHPKSVEAAEAAFMHGRASEAAGDQDGAKTAYASYLSRFPAGTHRAEARLRLARFEPGAEGGRLLEQLLSDEAEPALAAQAHFELGERLTAEGDLPGAATHYRAVVETYPESGVAPAARFGLAWCLYSAGEYGDATRELKTLASQRDLEADTRLAALELLVWAERKSGNTRGVKAAFVAFSADCTDEPRRFEAAKVAAGALQESKEHDQAQELFAGLLDGTRDGAIAVAICVERAYLYLDEGNADEAERQLRAAHKYSPEDPALAEAFFFAGEARFEAGDDAAAAELYAVAAGSATAEVAQRALYKGGFALLRAGDNAGAAKRFRKLVEQHGSSELYGESLFLLGESHYRAGEFAEAATWLDRVRSEVPKHEVAPKALFRLGVARARNEEWRMAGEVLAQLAREHPEFENAVEAELWRGRALSNLDQARGARQAFERVIDKDRGVLSAQAHIELGRLALAAGNRDDALSAFLKVTVLYALDEEVAEALYMAGQVLEAQGETDSAIEQYREVLADHKGARFAGPARERIRALGK